MFINFPRLTSSLALGVLATSVALAQSKKSPTSFVEVNDSLNPAFSQSVVLGAPSPTTKLSIAIGLVPSDGLGLQAFVNSVSDPKSPNYRHFLTPEQIATQFGASDTDVNNVVAYLKSQGLSVSLVSRQHLGILTEGTVAQFESAFHTQIKNVIGQDPNGRVMQYRANMTALSVPANISNVVESVAGLDTYARPHALDVLTPALAKVAYGLSGAATNGFTGAGMNIGISNWDGYLLTDAIDFINFYGLPTPSGGAGSNIHIVAVSGSTLGNSAGAEGDLDQQMVLTGAPLANIYVYDDGSSLLATLTLEANNNTCDVITESYGWSGVSGGTLTSCHNEHLAMSAEGITYVAATGDSGTSISTYPYPDVEPEVLGVGGAATTFSGGVVSSWGDWVDSGGGYITAAQNVTLNGSSVNINVLQSWQVGTGVPTNLNYRLQPDIALQACGNTGDTEGSNYFYYNGSLNSGYVGTSFAAPQFAGALAILEQQLVANGQTRRFGRIANLAYSDIGKSSIFYDVTSGPSTGKLPNGTATAPTVGWDFTTGVGVPNIGGWYTSLASQPIAPTGYTAYRGVVTGGNLASLTAYDQNYLTVELGPTLNSTEKPVQIIVTGTSGVASASAASLTITVGGYSVAGISQVVEVYNYSTSSYTTLSSASASTTDSKTTYTISNPSQYISSTGAVQARVSYYQSGPTLSYPWFAYIDQVTWTVTP